MRQGFRRILDFGPVTARELRAAEAFFAELTGRRPLAGAPNRAPRRRTAAQEEAESFYAEFLGETLPEESAEDGPVSDWPKPLTHPFMRWDPSWRGMFPPRPSGALGGQAFMGTIAGAGDPSGQAWLDREAAMVRELVSGNMPDALLKWVEIDLPAVSRGGRRDRPPPPVKPGHPSIAGKVRVLVDYLAIGSDKDYVYAPLDPDSAQRVADELGAMLPTARVCHAVYSATRREHRIARIERDYFQTDPQRRRSAPKGISQASTAAYLEHSEAIRKVMAARGIAFGTLVAGHKKDVVISKLLNESPDHIAFHGFYDPAGFPTEPCYEPRRGTPKPDCWRDLPTIAHRRRFSDYSQGVRLMDSQMIVDGTPQPVAKVLSDPELCWLLSREGPIVPARIPAAPTRSGARAGGSRPGESVPDIPTEQAAAAAPPALSFRPRPDWAQRRQPPRSPRSLRSGRRAKCWTAS